jgi:hypothetical protein
MKKQDYSNHVRWYVPHHFVLYPVLFGLLFISAAAIYRETTDALMWKLFAVAIAISGWISFMMRQHYALTLQNRIVRLEMRLRYYQLTGKRFELVEPQLSFGQIAALRFSSDGELQELLDKAIAEKLSPNQIKKMISNWQPDDMRV